MAGSSAGPRIDRTEESIAVLAGRHFLSAPEYWREHATVDGQGDGARVADMLIEVAKIFPAGGGRDDAIDALVQLGAIGSPAVWEQQLAILQRGADVPTSNH
jgi:hypothetical protein